MTNFHVSPDRIQWISAEMSHDRRVSRGPLFRAMAAVSGLRPCFMAGGVMVATVLLTPAFGADFTVGAGETGTVTKTLANPGDIGTVETGGTISITGVTGVNALEMNNTDQILVVSGSISTTGSNNDGIRSDGINAVITIGGSISTTGFSADALRSTGGNSLITNDGSISTAGSVSNGIVSFGVGTMINNGGSIKTTGLASDAIDAIGNNIVINNSGFISTTETGAHGINSSGENVLITNDGSITTAEFAAHGIFSDGDNAVINNNGTIAPTGNGSGIFSDGNNAVINNRGFLLNANGIFSRGINAVVITNSGTISSNNTGIQSTTNGAVIINSGSISTIRNGIAAKGSDAMIINSGSITTTGGSSSEGIVTSKENAIVINSGLIRAANDQAIRLLGANSTLILLPGSIIDGEIHFNGTSGPKTLIVANGLNVTLTTDAPWDVVSTAGAPFVISGNTVAVFDPTVVSQADRVLADVSGGIFNTVSAQATRPGGGGSQAASTSFAQLAMTTMGETRKNFDTLLAQTRSPKLSLANGYGGFENPTIWLRGFGGFRDEDSDNGTGSLHRYGGFVFGSDGVWEGRRIGYFGGAATGKFEVDRDLAEVRSRTYFGGAYADLNWGPLEVGTILTVGYVDNDRERLVANNLAPNGFETGLTSYSGAFAGVELGASWPTPLSEEVRIVPSARVRYTGLIQETASESGISQPLTVDNPDIHLVSGRLQLALEFGLENLSPALRGHGSIWSGVEGQDNFGNSTVDATLLGQQVSFDTGDDNVVSIFGGVGFAIDTNIVGLSLSLLAEGGRETGHGATVFNGVFEIRYAF